MRTNGKARAGAVRPLEVRIRVGKAARRNDAATQCKPRTGLGLRPQKAIGPMRHAKRDMPGSKGNNRASRAPGCNVVRDCTRIGSLLAPCDREAAVTRWCDSCTISDLSMLPGDTGMPTDCVVVADAGRARFFTVQPPTAERFEDAPSLREH